MDLHRNYGFTWTLQHFERGAEGVTSSNNRTFSRGPTLHSMQTPHPVDFSAYTPAQFPATLSSPVVLTENIRKYVYSTVSKVKYII